MNLTISTLRGLLVAAAVALSAPVQGQGIPVIDSSSMAAQAAQHAESLAKYLEQITTLKAQLDRARQQYEAMTGTRNLGDILTDPAIRKALPPDVQAILSSTGDSYASIQSSINRIQNDEQLTGSYVLDRKNMAQRVEDLVVRSKAVLEQAQTGQQARLQQIDQLQAQINAASDPMAIAELQARLQVEQANILTDQVRADLLSRQLAAEKALIEEQAALFVSKSSFSIEALRAPISGSR